MHGVIKFLGPEKSESSIHDACLAKGNSFLVPIISAPLFLAMVRALSTMANTFLAN
jgi:hypothetical protein